MQQIRQLPVDVAHHGHLLSLSNVQEGDVTLVSQQRHRTSDQLDDNVPVNPTSRMDKMKARWQQDGGERQMGKLVETGHEDNSKLAAAGE